MKALSYVFFTVVGGICVCFVMSITVAIQQHKAEKAAESAPLSLPLPAVPR